VEIFKILSSILIGYFFRYKSIAKGTRLPQSPSVFDTELSYTHNGNQSTIFTAQD